MTTGKELYTKPVVCRPKNNEWFVFFQYWDANERKYKPFKRSDQLNRIKDPAEKEIEFKALRDARETWLKMGWNPITDPKFKARLSEAMHQVNNLKLMNFDQALDYSYKTKLPDWSKKTGQDYASKIKYLKEAAGEISLSSMRITDVKRAHLRLLLETVKKNRELTAAGYNIYREYLSSLMGELDSWEVIEYNPVTKIKTKPEIKKVAHREPTPDEQITIITRVITRSRSYYRFLSVLYGCTIRPKEICALKIKTLIRDLQAFRLIPEERASDKQNNTKTRNERDVTVPTWVVDLLNEMNLHRYPEDWYIFSAKGPAGTFMPGPTRMHSNTPTRWWRDIVKEPEKKGGLGMDVDQYSLKKLSATHMVRIQRQENAEKPLELAKKQMGHASDDMSAIYTDEHNEILKGLVRDKMPMLYNTKAME